MPQGTLVARLHAHASGEPAIYTPTGANTEVEHGGIPIRYKPGGMSAGVLIPGNKKEGRDFDGRRFILEPAIAGDVAFVHAWKADEVGNLVFRYTANNYNGVMARNAKLTIVEAEEIVYVHNHVWPELRTCADAHYAGPSEACLRTRSMCLASTSIAS